MEKHLEKILLKYTETEKYADWGIRVIGDTDPAKIGDKGLISQEYRDGELTGDTLPGVSALKLAKKTIKEVLSQLSEYSGRRMAIVKGVQIESGYDKNEIVLSDNEIVDIIPISQLV